MTTGRINQVTIPSYSNLVARVGRPKAAKHALSVSGVSLHFFRVLLAKEDHQSQSRPDVRKQEARYWTTRA